MTRYSLILILFVLVGCNTSRKVHRVENTTTTDDNSTISTEMLTKDRSIVTTIESVDTTVVIPADSMVVSNKIGIPFTIILNGQTMQVDYKPDSSIRVRHVKAEQRVKVTVDKKTVENRNLETAKNEQVQQDIKTDSNTVDKQVEAKKANWLLYAIIGITVILALIIFLAYKFIKSKT